MPTPRNRHPHCPRCKERLVRFGVRCPRCEDVIFSWRLFPLAGLFALGFIGILKSLEFLF